MRIVRLNVTSRKLVCYTVRGINNQYKDIRKILKTQREKSLEEVHEILKEEVRKNPNAAETILGKRKVPTPFKRKTARDAISGKSILQRCVGTVKITKKIITNNNNRRDRKLPIITTDEIGRRILIRTGEMQRGRNPLIVY